MPDLKWSLSIQVSGGTTLTASGNPQAVEAVDEVEVVVSPGDTDKVVEVQPAVAARIRLLVIRSSTYGPTLTYKVSDGSADSAAVTLDAVHVFSGGTAAMFGVAPRQLKLSNATTGKEAKVRVFVARDATP